MKEKIKYFRESIKLVWQSAPGWTFVNIVISVLRSFLPLLLLWLLKSLVDGITAAVSASPGQPIMNILWPVIAVVIIWFLDEAASDISNFCLLYTSDAADEEDSVDLGGRRIIK